MHTYTPSPYTRKAPVPAGTQALLEVYRVQPVGGGTWVHQFTDPYDDIGECDAEARRLFEAAKNDDMPYACVIAVPDGGALYRLTPDSHYQRDALAYADAMDAAQRQGGLERGETWVD